MNEPGHGLGLCSVRVPLQPGLAANGGAGEGGRRRTDQCAVGVPRVLARDIDEDVERADSLELKYLRRSTLAVSPTEVVERLDDRL